MLHNLINRRDFYDLFHITPAVLASFASKLKLSEHQRIKSAWEHVNAPPTNWWDIPLVRARWNCLITGTSETGYHQYISQKWPDHRRDLLALSLGCGTGHNELTWASLKRFSRIDAYDFSTQRIQAAVDAALKGGYSQLIRYAVGDVFSIEITENRYDVIMVEQSLHHFSPLDELLSRISAWLKKDGYFVVNEYVGPHRFQWTKRQMEAANGLLSLLPVKYKTLWNSNTVKKSVMRPSHLRMILSDPSEAIESDQIVPLLRSKFDIIEFKGYGGSILHLLFNGIAHHFLQNDAETHLYLDIIFQVEDMLLQSHDIQHDFIIAVCKKR
jgi:ubiquinone/menaquinone biosynthesis C-methylase UbiE